MPRDTNLFRAPGADEVKCKECGATIYLYRDQHECPECGEIAD